MHSAENVPYHFSLLPKVDCQFDDIRVASVVYRCDELNNDGSVCGVEYESLMEANKRTVEEDGKERFLTYVMLRQTGAQHGKL